MRLIPLAVAALLATTCAVHSASALSVQSCPPGYTGVIIENNGGYTSVCQNSVGGHACPSGTTGYVVMVGGRYVSACLAT